MKILKVIAAIIIAIAIAAAAVVLTAPAWLASAETAGGTAAVQPFVKINPGAKVRTVREVRKVRTVRGVRKAGDQ